MARSLGFILIAGLAFATSGPLARWGRPLDPIAIAFGRVTLAALVLLAIDLRRTFAELRALDARARTGIALAGLLLGAHFACFQGGMDRTSLPAAISLVSLEPLSVVAWAWLAHGVRPRPIEQLGVLCATAGALLVASGAGAGDHRLFGDALVLGAVLLYGAYLSVARSYTGRLHPRRYAALVYSCAAFFLAVGVLLLPLRTGTQRWPIAPHAAIAVLLLAAIPTIIGHTMVQSAMQRISPSLVALVSPIETVGGLAIGAVLLGAKPSLRELAGGIAIVAGVTTAALGMRSTTAPPTAAEPRAATSD